ncbi:MAG: hypothetical protein AWU58_2102 [Methanohalophilus sp. T328-1]|nr:MAG: hypothetical protein AWU58_2102 [Methanohalophilus sp. T328-1]
MRTTRLFLFYLIKKAPDVVLFLAINEFHASCWITQKEYRARETFQYNSAEGCCDQIFLCKYTYY